MAADSGKKVIILYILNILRKYTDFNHPMTQQEIADKLMDDYEMPVNRATRKVRSIYEDGGCLCQWSGREDHHRSGQ